MQTVKLALEAMATRFELVLQGQSASGLRSAGEEALGEIKRLERQLSFFYPESDIARVNARAAREPVRVSPIVFDLLQRCRRMTLATDGAFDITAAPLARCWGFLGGGGHAPAPRELASARSRVGISHILLDEDDFSVRFDQPGVMLDLGAVGKGFALDRAAGLLREAGITSALLHGGTSSVYAIGSPLDAAAWKVSVELPEQATGRAAPQPQDLLAVVQLRDESLSVSAVWGRSFELEGKRVGHVIDPRTGQPVCAAVLSALVLASAEESDALSTALLVLGAQGLEALARFAPQARGLVASPCAGGFDVAHYGL